MPCIAIAPSNNVFKLISKFSYVCLMKPYFSSEVSKGMTLTMPYESVEERYLVANVNSVDPDQAVNPHSPTKIYTANSFRI